MSTSTGSNPRLGRVLVTTPSFGAYSGAPRSAAADEGLELVASKYAHPLDAARLIEELQGFDALITGLDDVNAEVLAAVPGLKIVAKHGVGVDNIDILGAVSNGIVVVNAPGTNSGAVADLTLGLMIAASR